MLVSYLSTICNRRIGSSLISTSNICWINLFLCFALITRIMKLLGKIVPDCTDYINIPTKNIAAFYLIIDTVFTMGGSVRDLYYISERVMLGVIIMWKLLSMKIISPRYLSRNYVCTYLRFYFHTSFQRFHAIVISWIFAAIPADFQTPVILHRILSRVDNFESSNLYSFSFLTPAYEFI